MGSGSSGVIVAAGETVGVATGVSATSPHAVIVNTNININTIQRFMVPPLTQRRTDYLVRPSLLYAYLNGLIRRSDAHSLENQPTTEHQEP